MPVFVAGLGKWLGSLNIQDVDFRLFSSPVPLLSTVLVSSFRRPCFFFFVLFCYSFLSLQLSSGLCKELCGEEWGGHQTSNCFQNRLSRDFLFLDLPSHLSPEVSGITGL